jgi:hypothetical protein
MGIFFNSFLLDFQFNLAKHVEVPRRDFHLTFRVQFVGNDFRRRHRSIVVTVIEKPATRKENGQTERWNSLFRTVYARIFQFWECMYKERATMP